LKRLWAKGNKAVFCEYPPPDVYFIVKTQKLFLSGAGVFIRPAPEFGLLSNLPENFGFQPEILSSRATGIFMLGKRKRYF
jgi:hypothetical protein